MENVSNIDLVLGAKCILRNILGSDMVSNQKTNGVGKDGIHGKLLFACVLVSALRSFSKDRIHGFLEFVKRFLQKFLFDFGTEIAIAKTVLCFRNLRCKVLLHSHNFLD